MKQEIIYEWWLEEIDEYGDIVDHDFSETICWDKVDKNHQLCLVRRKGDEVEGLAENLYAYVDGGELPNCFDESSIKVPKRYKEELNNWIKKLSFR